MNGKPRRVLLICDSYPPVIGGSEIEAQRVSAAMIRRGHRVEVLCAGGPPMPQLRNWIDPEGVPVTILTRHSRKQWKDRVYTLGVAYELWRRRRHYDVVYFLMQGLHLAVGLPLSRLLKKPAVMKIAGSRVIPEMRRSRMGRMELDCLQKWRIPLMILNEGMVEEALADGFPREQLVWMPNPVDIDEFRPARSGEREAWRQEYGIPAQSRVVIYVGRLSHEKGIQGLLRGFARAARIPDAMLILAGDGALRPELEDLVRELALEPGQVRFLGRIPASKIPSWLRVSDVFSLLSPSEGFSCALLEAMASGLPSVVSAIPANVQLIDNEVHGLTVPFDDTEAYGEAFSRLLLDPELCQVMGEAARRRTVENYSTDKVLDRYEALFDRVMAESAVPLS